MILPQATRVIIPPLGNEFNSLIKATTLMTIIGGAELFNGFEQVNGVIFRPFELFLAASFYYLAFTLGWDAIQKQIESRLGEAKATRCSSLLLRLVWRDGRRREVGVGA